MQWLLHSFLESCMLAHWTLTKYCFCFGAIKTKQNKQKTVLMVLEKPNEMPEMEPRLVVLQGKKLTRKNKAVLSSPNQSETIWTPDFENKQISNEITTDNPFPSINYSIGATSDFIYLRLPRWYSSALRCHSWLGDHMGFQGIEPGSIPGWPHARQTPYHCATTLTSCKLHFKNAFTGWGWTNACLALIFALSQILSLELHIVNWPLPGMSLGIKPGVSLWHPGYRLKTKQTKKNIY